LNFDLGFYEDNLCATLISLCKQRSSV